MQLVGDSLREGDEFYEEEVEAGGGDCGVCGEGWGGEGAGHGRWGVGCRVVWFGGFLWLLGGWVLRVWVMRLGWCCWWGLAVWRVVYGVVC